MNSSERIAVDRYAVAFDKLSKTVEEASALCSDLKIASQELLKSEDYMKSPKITLATKKQFIKDALQSNRTVASFVELLLDSKRYNLLPFIAEQVEQLLEQRMGILRATVLSAKDISAQQKQQIESVLSARYQKTVKAHFEKDETLLGGLKILCSGELIDGSLQGKLVRLQAALTK